MKKYELPKKMLKDKILDQMIKDFKKNNREHMRNKRQEEKNGDTVKTMNC